MGTGHKSATFARRYSTVFLLLGILMISLGAAAYVRYYSLAKWYDSAVAFLGSHENFERLVRSVAFKPMSSMQQMLAEYETAKPIIMASYAALVAGTALMALGIALRVMRRKTTAMTMSSGTG